MRPTITIRFDSKFQIIAQLFDSIRNEKTLFAHHYSVTTVILPVVSSATSQGPWFKMGPYGVTVCQLDHRPSSHCYLDRVVCRQEQEQEQRGLWAQADLASVPHKQTKLMNPKKLTTT